MKQRCSRAGGKAKWYADKGIEVCPRWGDFENFLSDMGRRPKGMSLDRIDGSKGYYKENCRWADRKTQMRNKCTNVNLTFNGKTQCTAAWSEELGIQRQTIQQRAKKGWPVEKVLSKAKYERVTCTQFDSKQKSAIKRQQASGNTSSPSAS
jgi:hypothetical protein